jgi:hypothetical protein
MSGGESESAPIAVVDTSVLVPVWSRIALQTIADRPSPPYHPVWSEWIIAETWRVLTWRWAQRGLAWDDLSASANSTLRYLIKVIRLESLYGAAIPGIPPPSIEPNDLPVWITAVLADARYIVSDNTRDFPPLIEERAIVDGRARLLSRHRLGGIEWITAIEFIQDILEENPEDILGRPLPPSGIVRSRRGVRDL